MADVIMRVCGWCGEDHPDHLSIVWTFGGRLYFCSARCHREWREAG